MAVDRHYLLCGSAGLLWPAILGYALDPTGAGPGAGAGGSRILQYPPGVPCCGPGGVNLVNATVRAFDHDGDGVDVGDVMTYLADLGTGTYFGRSDHDHGGTVNVLELSELMHCYRPGRSKVDMNNLTGGGTCE